MTGVPNDQSLDAAQRVLKSVFGFAGFRPGQEAAIRTLLDRRHLLAVMPTGSGKSLCFQVPALMTGGLTLVVSPLVALMEDQVTALRLAGVAADCINSNRDRHRNVSAWHRVAAGETRLLYMAPERLMTDRMLAALSRLSVSLIAIDEAHCISQWGPAFRPEYEDLSRLRTLFPDVPIAAFTATADEVTRNDIAEKLFGNPVEPIVLGFDRPNISLAVEMKADWKRQLRTFVGDRFGQSGIVYCLSRKKTEEAAALLTDLGIRALPYHAGMDKEARDAHQDLFMTEPGMVMVATIAFGMGIDKPDVRFVYHTDLPGGIEAYYQEIGRAGRDGAPAEAHMIYGLSDIRMRRQFIEDEDSGPERKRREHKRLDALLGFCEAPECRRVALLAYFGERIAPCGACDCCRNPGDRFDGTEDARKILSAVYRSGQRFGSAHVIDILRGTETDKIRKFGHHRLPTFGVGRERSRKDWQSMIRQMVATGLLQLDIGGYGGLSISRTGTARLKGDGTVHFRLTGLVPTPQSASRPGSGSGKETRRAGADATADEFSSEQRDLLDQLKALRLKLATERGVPAYVIFHDRTLIDMVRRNPRSRQEFSEVHGVGAAKLEQFAEPFLAAVVKNQLDTG